MPAPMPDHAEPQLRSAPDWPAAAEALVHGCVWLDDVDARVDLLERVCRGLGDSLYPAFVNLLCAVADAGDAQAHAVIADTLVHALRTGRLPAGRLSSWGGSGTAGPFGPGRALGPLEYLCAWHAQPSGRPPLGALAFDRAAIRIVNLMSASPEACALYRRKLLVEADDPLSGALARGTRDALRAMALAWDESVPAAAVVDAGLDALRGGSGLSVLAAAPAGWLPRAG